MAAFLVLYNHSFALALGSEKSELVGKLVGLSPSSMAVDTFFIISGFLITGSYISKDNIVKFLIARSIRIFPALVVANLICVFIVGLAFTQLSISEYLTERDTYKFLRYNSFLLKGVVFSLPGVFEDNIYKHTVNGSLWTLPYELKMYLIVGLMLYIISVADRIFNMKFKARILFLALSLILMSLHLLNNFFSFCSPALLRFSVMFFSGVTFFLWKDFIFLSRKAFVVTLSLLFIGAFNDKVFYTVYCLSLPYIVFYLAYIPSGVVRKFNKFGDYSYGMYIYAFPVQQSVAALMPGVTVVQMLYTSFCITLCFALVSWHLIEQKFLMLNKRVK